MGLTRLSSAAKTLSIASAILLIDSILSAWAFHTLPSAWPRRESRGMTAAPTVMSRNYQFISNVNCCRSLTRSTAKDPAFSACDLILQCCGSSSLSSRPPRILPPTAYSPFVGGWASASSVRRPGWRKPRERSGGALCMVDSGGGKRESARNRALGSVVYLLPLLDGIDCGENVFRVWPEFGNLLHLLLGPALAVWQHVPFMPLVMFVILQISVRRQDTSRFVRFNVQQAILVDILTVVLGLLGTAVGYFNPEGEQFMTNFAFYCLAGAVVYAVSETVKGRVANQIPLISAAAEIQIGP